MNRVVGRAILAAFAVVTAGLLAPRPLHSAAPSLQVYFAADFTDAAYQKQTYQKVASAWKRPVRSPKAGSKAVVIVVIQRDGSIPPPTLHLASGSDEWDAAALAAVKSAAPFAPLPKGYARASVEVHFHFEYH